MAQNKRMISIHLCLNLISLDHEMQAFVVSLHWQCVTKMCTKIKLNKNSDEKEDKTLQPVL